MYILLFHSFNNGSPVLFTLTLLFFVRDIPLVPSPVNGPVPVLSAADVQDGPQQPCGCLPLCWAWQSSDWAEEPDHAPEGQQPQVSDCYLPCINLRCELFVRFNELKHVVIVGNADYVEREWDTLEMLPKILVLHGSPMSRADLRAVNVNLSDMCVILSAKMSSVDDPSMADKEAVLATLNINAMTFNKVWTFRRKIKF